MIPKVQALRKAAAKKRKADEAGGSRKKPRPRSPTPPQSRSPTPLVRRQRAERAPHVDLTDSPSQAPRVEAEVEPRIEVGARIELGTEAEFRADIDLGAEAEAGAEVGATKGIEVETEARAVARSPVEAASLTPDAAPASSASTQIPKRGRARPSVLGPSVLRPSLMSDGRRAERMISRICPPEFQRELNSQGASSFFREAFVAHLWAANSLAAVKGVLSRADASLVHVQQEADEARARAEKAEKDLEAALARAQSERVSELERALEAARSEKAEMEIALEKVRAERAEQDAALEKVRAERAAEREQAERALGEARRQADAEIDNARAAEEKQKTLEAELLSCQLRLQTVSLSVDGAELRAADAEEIARRSDARAAAAEADREEALRTAEEKVLAAERGRAKALEDFRRSEEFEEEITEASAFAYNQGFQDCKEKARRVLGLELGDLEPDEVSEELPTTPHSADDGSAPAKL